MKWEYHGEDRAPISGHVGRESPSTHHNLILMVLDDAESGTNRSVAARNELPSPMTTKTRSRMAVLTELCASKKHRAWLDRYRKEEHKLCYRRHRKQQDSSSVQQQIYQILSLFSFFQGSILTALVQSGNALGCERWWVPFAISLTTAVAALGSLVPKLRCLRYHHWEIGQAHGEIDAVRTAIDKLMSLGGLLDISDTSNEPLDILSSSTPSPGDHTPIHRRLQNALRHRVFDILVDSTIILLSSVVMFACRRLLCLPLNSRAACNAACSAAFP